MRTFVLSSVVVALLATPAFAKPKGKSAGKVVGRVFWGSTVTMDIAKADLAKHFRSQKPEAQLKRQGRDKWSGVLVAFFRKKSYPGPISIWFYDKSDKAAIKAKEPAHYMSIDVPPDKVIAHPVDLFGADGFNKGRTYLVWVGQILNRRPKIYARGELTLSP